MSNEIFREIELELTLLHRLFTTFSSDIEKYRESDPSEFDLGALGSILNAFYNGIEKIFIRIASKYDGHPVKSDIWHIELLEMMMESNTKRPAVISKELKARLQNYLSFRHVFKHIYTFDLQWHKMKDVLLSSEETLHLLEAELQVFMDAISNNI